MSDKEAFVSVAIRVNDEDSTLCGDDCPGKRRDHEGDMCCFVFDDYLPTHKRLPICTESEL